MRTSFYGSQLRTKGLTTDVPIISFILCLRDERDVKDFQPICLSGLRKQPPSGDRRSTGSSRKFGP